MLGTQIISCLQSLGVGAGSGVSPNVVRSAGGEDDDGFSLGDNQDCFGNKPGTSVANGVRPKRFR